MRLGKERKSLGKTDVPKLCTYNDYENPVKEREREREGSEREKDEESMRIGKEKKSP